MRSEGYMKTYIWILITALAFTGCKKDNQNDGDYAFIGGEIINPNTDYVVLSKSEEAIDTIKLDGKNRFVYKVKNLDAGLYTFRHGGEIQMVLLEPNDSIMFRLNTLDFDESLVYTGEGAKKNNYFIDEFLQNENEEKKIFKYCQLNADDYAKKIESIKVNKLNKLKAFRDKYDTSELFNKIADANIKYNYYFNKEIYPFVHYGHNKNDILASLPNDFYDYRDNIDYNDDFLKDYLNYNSFLRSHFNNLALKEHFNHSKSDYFNKNDTCYNLDKLKLIDSLVSNQHTKEYLLYNCTIGYLNKSKNAQNNEAILASYLKRSHNSKDRDMVTRYSNAISSLTVGSKMPEVILVNYNEQELNINSVINAPTVLCFWSQTFYKHFKESHYKINELKTKYPEVKFIVVNIDGYGLETPRKSLISNHFSKNDEYIFKNPEAAIEALAIYPMTKVMLVDKHQKIVNGHVNIFSANFEEQLLGLLNRPEIQ